MNENLNIYYVYYLRHPDTNEIFYIGKGKGYRMYKHESQVKNNKFPNNNYALYKNIKLILSENKNIIYEKIAENLNNKDAIELEKNKIKEIGLNNLTNICEGGEGNDNFTFNPNKETIRLKMSCAQKKSYIEKYGEERAKEIIQKRLNSIKGYKHTKETKDKIKKSNTGKKRNDETKKNIGLSKIGNTNMLGKTHSVDSRLKMRESHIGKVLTELHKKNISIANTGKKRSDEFSENLSERMLLNPPTKRPEVRKKISIALKGKKAYNKYNYICVQTPDGKNVCFDSIENTIEFFRNLSDELHLINNKRISAHQIIFKGESKGYKLVEKCVMLNKKSVIPLVNTDKIEQTVNISMELEK